jgi:hypothetical protein
MGSCAAVRQTKRTADLVKYFIIKKVEAGGVEVITALKTRNLLILQWR